MASSPSGGAGPSFFLVPENASAHKAVNDTNNDHFLRLQNGTPSLYLDFSDLVDGKITLGRSGSMIFLPDHHGAGIHRTHCYFQCSKTTGAVILHDKSSNHTTLAYDDDADFSVPISNVENSVVVTKLFNRSIAIGNRRHYKFKLVWESDGPVREFLLKHPSQFGPGSCESAHARYIQGEVLGYGGFGMVNRAVHIHNGKALAVKRFHNLDGKRHVMAIREANNMVKLASNGSRKCDHILSIIDTVYDKETFQWIEIFMPLKDGSVRTLIEVADRVVTDDHIAQNVLYQMAKALKFMAKHKMIHRDIKPDNILYDTRIEADGFTPYYHFLLADFNLSNETADARTYVGTEKFMAPEVCDRKLQACTVDIWSLFVTIVWIYDTDGFRSYETIDNMELRDKITEIAQQDMYAHIRDMAIQDPSRRVSASRLLARLEGSSASMPQSSLSEAMSDMTIHAGINDEADSAYGYSTSYINKDVAQSFANKYSPSRQRAGPSSMTGHSALEEDFAHTNGPVLANAYQTGVLNEHYQYTYQSPRNEEVELDAAAQFDESNEEEAGDDVGEDDDHHDKGKGTDNTATASPYFYYN